jgi:ribosomal protein S18 acetylase RimI-like enzyme
MITKLQNKDLETAHKIHTVFQASYAIEAKLLNANDFPPLKRTLENFIASNTDFFGYLKHEEIAAVIEIATSTDYTHIQSLVVHPDFFRQGIAHKLMDFIFNTYDSKLFIVETGVDNGPASELYKKLGFIEVKQWDTPFGIRKIRFEKKINSYDKP